MHNHSGKDNSSTMWMMAVCCGLPVFLIVIFGVGGKSLGVSTWVIIGVLAITAIAHFFLMGRSRKEDEHPNGTGNKSQEKPVQSVSAENKKEKKHGACCH